MNLIIITQKVDKNDSNLGFFHDWLEKFASKLDKVFVIAGSVGQYDLPSNVEVFSLGKEKGHGKIWRFFRLQKALWQNLKKSDGIFCHMCPIYVILAWPLAKIRGKKIILWFTHKSVNLQLKLAGLLANKIITASAESCRLKNRRKIEVLGHGIDVSLFSPLRHPEPLVCSRGEGSQARDSSASPQNDKCHLLTAGRISPSKDLKTLIEALAVLSSNNQLSIINYQLMIVGCPVDESGKKYLAEIKELIKQKNLQTKIIFLGKVSHQQMPRYYNEADLFVNLSQTGSIDKAVLEAMACSCPVLTCNEAFVKILPAQNIFPAKNPQALAQKIIALQQTPPSATPLNSLRQLIVEQHNLATLIDKIIKMF